MIISDVHNDLSSLRMQKLKPKVQIEDEFIYIMY